MSDPTELDELESGLTSGFWQRVKAHAEHEWGPTGETYLDAIKRAAQGPSGSEADAVHRLKVVLAIQDAMTRFVKWPEERIAMIRDHVRRKSDVGLSRRGPGI